MAIPALAGATTVASYLSMPSEPGTGPLNLALLHRGIRVLVPRALGGGQMEWVELREGAPVAAGDLRVPEPVGESLGEGALASCQLAFVPALAVDYAGHRLGRGAGYYDRALAGPGPVVCAVVFTEELLDRVPSEPHDVPVDLALTPGGLFRIARDDQ